MIPFGVVWCRFIPYAAAAAVLYGIDRLIRTLRRVVPVRARARLLSSDDGDADVVRVQFPATHLVATPAFQVRITH